MSSNQWLWTKTKEDLVKAIEDLGFRAEPGEAIAGHLGSPKAIERMIAYLHYVKPEKEELVIDEMLYYGLTDNEE